MPDMATLARRGLTPLLVLLVVAPPRVCTCEHQLAPASHVAHDDGDADDPPTPCHPHPPGPVGDPDCPCVQPAQVKAAVAVNNAQSLPPSEPRPEFVAPEPARVGPHPLPVDPRSADPPLYLTGCALRF
jgi:hypothetical protein